MKSKRFLVVLSLVVATLLAAWFLFLGSGLWDSASAGRVKKVPAGHQEIAWIAPATGNESWERLVTSLTLLEKEWKKYHGPADLTLDTTNAFSPLTTGVPEVGLHFGDKTQTLWIRWYKLSGDNSAESWIDKLAARETPPVAIIGGETTDRALTLATALEAARSKWQGAAPLFLITTATAHTISPGDDRAHAILPEHWPLLMNAYRGKSFRYSFTNTRMVEAMLDFLQENPQVWAAKSTDPADLAGLVALGDPWGTLGGLGAMGHLQPRFLFAVSWMDDTYSRDMVSIGVKQFHKRVESKLDQPLTPKEALEFYEDTQVPFSAGGYLKVNSAEGGAIGGLLATMSLREKNHFILLLPTGAQRVRRFVADLARQAQLDMRRCVVLNGDSMSFNTVFRDGDTAWNVLDVPVPLVFFSHRLPTSAAAGFRWQATPDDPGARTGTQELLLDRDIGESLLLAAFDRDKLLGDADQIMKRLRRSLWYKGRVYNGLLEDVDGSDLFSDGGDRNPGTGEHIVWVQPLFDKSGRILSRGNISIWGTNAKDIHRWLIRPEIAPPVTVSYQGPSETVVHRRLEDWARFSAVHRLADPNETAKVEEAHD